MIVYKRWVEKPHGIKINTCDGWFLFGLIPLYIRKVAYDAR